MGVDVGPGAGADGFYRGGLEGEEVESAGYEGDEDGCCEESCFAGKEVVADVFFGGGAEVFAELRDWWIIC